MIRPSEVITTHKGADFDALASMVAASMLHPNAVMVFSGSADHNVREYLASDGSWIEVYTPKKVRIEAVDKLVVVDTNAFGNLDKFSELVRKEDVELWIYDHHPPRSVERKFNGMIRPAGATTTILVKLLKERGISISKQQATLFALGIYEDTGMFTFASTTQDDFDIAKYLFEIGADLTIIPHYLSMQLTDVQEKIFEEMVDSSEEEYVGGCKVVISVITLKGYTEGLALLVHRLRDFFAADVVVALVKTGKYAYIISRSRGTVDVNKVLSKFGGGGHPYAASAVVELTEFPSIKERLKRAIFDSIGVGKILVRDAMTSPVKSVQPSATVDEVLDVMVRYGHSGLPVVRDGRLVGIITRKDLDKAKFHGLGEQVIERYMSIDVITIQKDASLKEAHRLMVENRIGRIPVIDSQGIVGIITRTDLLKALYGETKKDVSIVSDGVIVKGNVWKMVESQLEPRVVELLKSIGDYADSRRWNVYLIGGGVRDLLLGKSSIDIDIVVEGGGIEFAEHWRARGCKIAKFPEFGTAVIGFPDGLKVDVATARREFYEYPASLPKIMEFGSLKHDLYRRDFTINAMAIQLNDDGRRGRLIDYFGGLDDLHRGVIRVLHNLSFVEDPTRIIRAIRFSERFGFEIEPKSLRLLKNAVFLGFLERLSGKRIMSELNAVFSEITAWKIISRMYKMGVLQEIIREIKLQKEDIRLLRRGVWAVRNGIFSGLKKAVVFFMILVRNLDKGCIESVLERFDFARSDREAIFWVLSDADSVKNRLLQESLKNSEIYSILASFSSEKLCYLYIVGGKILRKRIKYYVIELSRVKPEMTGKKLMELGVKPGPVFKEVLEKLKLKVMDGEVSGIEEEIDFVRKEIGRC